MKYNSLFLTLLSCLPLTLNDPCCRFHKEPGYKLIRRNGYSKQPIISRKIVIDLERCKEFAASKKALAFNFGLSEEFNDNVSTSYANRRRSLQTTCQALQCPETNNFTTFVNDTNFNYYSTYPANISMSIGNLVCVPRIGLFIFPEKRLNYSDARNWCQKSRGFLADVIGEERTNGLASFVSHGNPHFIGLSSLINERIWRNEFSEPLSCFDYRAWGNGEPSNSRGCVALVGKSSTDSSPFWKVLSCRAVLPFICEISGMRRKITL